MTSQTVRRVSECFIIPMRDLSPDAKQPIHFTPFELAFLKLKYTQKGLLFEKSNHDFSITAYLDDLRRSLSATLTHFYPLAARLATQKQENPPSYVIYIDPQNSPGVKFVHATLGLSINDILITTTGDVPSVVHSLFDLNGFTSLDGLTQPLLSVQVTELTDGIFIGCSVNHLVADGSSFWHFMASWSEIFRSRDKNGYSISRPPTFRQGSYPIINLPFIDLVEVEPFDKPQVKVRFFHFTGPSVSKLKEKANGECGTRKISSLQAVSALLWRCITRVRHKPNNGETVCKLAFNNRRRVSPPFSDNYFGSPVDVIRESATVGDLLAHGLGWAALRLHEAVKNHEDAAVEKWVESWNRSPRPHNRNEFYHPNHVVISSSPRFDMYGCEFGLGKAVAAKSGLMDKRDGKLVVYPGREGGGSMEVEVCLLPEYMMDLECDEEFISALKSN